MLRYRIFQLILIRYIKVKVDLHGQVIDPHKATNHKGIRQMEPFKYKYKFT